MKLVPVLPFSWNEPGASSPMPATQPDPFRHLADHLFDAAEDALLLLDTDARVLAVNGSWQVLTGHAGNALLDHTVYALLDQLEPDGLIDWLAGTLPTLAETTRARIHFRHSGGFRLDVGVSIEPVRDRTARLVLWLVRLKAVDPTEPYRAPPLRPASIRRGE